MSDGRVYKGPERRREQRRQGSERREDIRFEPDKDPRRAGRGRRRDDRTWDRRDR